MLPPTHPSAPGQGDAHPLWAAQGLQPGHGPRHRQQQGGAPARLPPHARLHPPSTAALRAAAQPLPGCMARKPRTVPPPGAACIRCPPNRPGPTSVNPVPPQGYAFAEFMDVHVTDIVIQNLNGKPCNTKFLTGEPPGQVPGARRHTLALAAATPALPAPAGLPLVCQPLPRWRASGCPRATAAVACLHVGRASASVV